ncbi:MAG TPA: MOSC N-terminal beta barrel domain-containing protein [Candidatus Limnocylindrales bacterium]|nr:MOSC N-terminal beta barrel domain-containing protein [Candidatus Limnocylindrales bacterium]
MPRVSRISIAPVRGLGLEHPDAVDLTDVGVVEDRRFYLIDDAGRHIDQLVSGALVQVAAHTDPDATRLRLALPDGTVIDEAVELGEAIETTIVNRIAVGHVVLGRWGDALEPFAGRRIRIVRCDRPGGTRVENAVSLITDGSLRELASRVGRPSVDGRRFRMLFELEGADPHEEDSWLGGQIAVGESVLSITKPDARCAITTQDPDTGARDIDTLRTIIGYRGLREGRKVDFGVLGEVATPGRVRLGDAVSVVTPGDDRFMARRMRLRAAAKAGADELEATAKA